MTKILSLTLLAVSPLASLAAMSPLDGKYRLDFYASSGQCVEKTYVRTSRTKVVTNIKPLQRTDYRLGAFCHDRRWGDTPPADAESCSTYVETNTLIDGDRAFESVWTSPRVIDGEGRRARDSLFTLRMVSRDRLQADLVGFDREGVEPKPVFRCFYDRVN